MVAGKKEIMKKFAGEDFLLHTKTAIQLYREFAEKLPVIDFHCHLPASQIAADIRFKNLTEIWLNGDHYKWRAMRANGVDEHYITGEGSDWEKFEKWAATVPYTLRNPLYHWTHLELQRYFNIHTLLDPGSAKKIYEECSERLREPSFSTRGLLTRMQVKLVCTTDDPVDSLEHHRQLREEGFSINVLPAFRPDRAMNVDDPAGFNRYVSALEEVSGLAVSSINDYLDALKSRHRFFAARGCTVSDHGLEEMYNEDYTATELKHIFDKLRSGRLLDERERRKIRTGLLFAFAEWDWEAGWVQQFHLGALRNNNSRKLSILGPDTGWDLSVTSNRRGRWLVF